MPPAHAAVPSRVAVVGPERVGKRALVLALGAQPARPQHTGASDDSGDGAAFMCGATHELRILHDRRQLAAFENENSGGGGDGNGLRANEMVVVVVFDLTRRESFEAALAQWSFATHGDSASRVLLVGTKLDLAHEREVFYEQASQIAEMQFGAYVEVSTAQLPFTCVDEVQRLLSEWTGSPLCSNTNQQYPDEPDLLSPLHPDAHDATDSTTDESSQEDEPDRRLSPKRKPCIRASVWLYDPTEDHPPSPEHDVKLRPISRALFEIRGAGQDKMKSIAKYKDREVNKIMQRSKYYGPTESSRHMRWQEEQKKMMTTNKQSSSFVHVRQRSASQGANTGRSYDRQREHELLETKSFAQTTELLRQRKLELMAKKALLAAGANTTHSRSHTGSSSSNNGSGTRSLTNSHIARDGAQQQKKTKKLTAAKLSSVPEEERVASEVSITTQFQTSRPELSIDTAAPVVVAMCPMDLISPGADQEASLPTPLPIAHLQSPVPPAVSLLYSASGKRRASSFSHMPSPTVFEFEMSFDPDGNARARNAECAGNDMSWDEALRIAGDIEEEGSPSAAFAIKEQQPEAKIDEEATTATTKTTRTTMDDAFDSSDIDDMLDYFDGVSLPI